MIFLSGANLKVDSLKFLKFEREILLIITHRKYNTSVKILFVTASYLPIVNGVSFQIDILRRAFEKRGHKVYILAPSFPGYKDSNKRIIRFPSLPNPFAKTYPLGIPLVSINKLKRLKLDVIHTHHPFVFGQFASQVSEKLKIPLFFTAHTQYEMYLNYYFPKGKIITSYFLKRDLRKLSQKCFKIIVPTTQTAERLKNLGINNLEVVNNGIENDFFQKPSQKNMKSPTLVYTGRLEREKDPLFLLKIAHELRKLIPNFKFIIIGSGSLVNKLNEKIIANKLQGNVILAGEVNRSLLPDVYNATHLFVTASTSEVMPLSIIEAMACGVPVIGIKSSGLEDFVVGGKSGYLLEKNPKLITTEIYNILNNKGVFNKLSLTTFDYAKKYFASNSVKQLEKIYIEAIFGK